MKIPQKTLAAVLLLASSAVFAQDSSAVFAQDSGVDVSFIPSGGVIYSVRPPGFTINYSFGSIQDDSYVIPRDYSLRNGCFLNTPWLPVSHEDGQAVAYPHITLEWWGELHPIEMPDQPLLRVQMEVKKPDGSVQQIRSYLHTGYLTKQYRATLPDGWISYYGRMDNPLSNGDAQNFGSIAVSEQDQVRYTLCDLYWGAKLSVKKLVVHTYPIF